MTPKVKATNSGILEILKSSETFKQVAGESKTLHRAMDSLKGAKIYQPGSDTSGFGGSPRFKLSSDSGIIPSEPDAVVFARLQRGHSRSAKKEAKRAEHHGHKLYARHAHKPFYPRQDKKVLAKYELEKKHVQALAKAHKAHRHGKLMPTLAVNYVYGPRALSLHPQYVYRFQNLGEACKAQKKGEINSHRLAEWCAPKNNEAYSLASGMAFYFRSNQS